MTSFVWENIFNSGIEAMDAQRRKIFDYMTTIYNDIADIRQKCDPVNGLLDQLDLLCKMHFMDEELLMEDMNYPSTAEHKHLHDLFLATIKRLNIENNRCHTPSLLNDFNKFRLDLITHIITETKVLSEFPNNPRKTLQV